MRKLGLAGLAAALCLAAATPAHAQGDPQMGARRGFNLGAMVMQGVNLTAGQQAKVDSITSKYRDQMRKAREDAQAAGGDMSGMRAQMQEMRQKQLDELRAVLTSDEQRATFDKNVEDLRNRRGTGRPPGGN